MKKWILIAAVLAVLGAGVWLYARFAGGDTMQIQVVRLEPCTVRRTVSCGGKIEASDVREVYADVPCVLGDVLVTEGQRVKAGDRLISTDRAATGEILQSVGISVSTDDLPEWVTTPVSGTVKTVAVHAGEVVDTETVCVEITPDARVQVAVQIPEQVMREVTVGQTVTVTGVAFTGEQYSGTLTEIADTAHTVAGATAAQTVVDAVVVLDEGCIDDSLRSGLTAKAVITVQTLESALVVPYGSVLQDDNGEEFVLVVENGRTAKRQIYIAHELPEGYLIAGGLSPDMCIVSSPEGVAAGAAVEAVYE